MLPVRDARHRQSAIVPHLGIEVDPVGSHRQVLEHGDDREDPGEIAQAEFGPGAEMSNKLDILYS